MRRLALDDERVRGIRLSRNYGQHNALLCGIRACATTSSSPWTTICSIRSARSPCCSRRSPRVTKSPTQYFERTRSTACGAISPRLTKLALQSAMGAKSAAQVSAFPAHSRHHQLAAAQDYRSRTFRSTTADLGDAALASVKHAPRSQADRTTPSQVDHARLQSDDRLPARCR